MKNRKKYKITILGLTYKEKTNSIKNSASIFLLKKLTKQNVVAYDPMADIQDLKLKIKRVNTISEALNDSDVLVLMTKWEEFRKIKEGLIISKMKGKLIIDPYGILENLNLKKSGYKYYRLGKK